MNIDKMPSMFALIFHDAFSLQAAVGGGFCTVFMTGVRRGLFSNEAGEGSVPNAAATASGKHPYVKQKNNGISEPVFDPSIIPDNTGIKAWQKK